MSNSVGTDTGPNMLPLVSYANNNIFSSGIYISISYDYPSRLTRLEITDWSGNLFINMQGTTPYTYTYNTSPFHMVMHSDSFRFYGGLLFSKTGYINYATYAPYFS